MRKIIALLCWLTASTAHAQASFDLQLFRPSPHSDAFITVESGAVARSLDVRAQLFLNYAYQPLALFNRTGRIASLDHRLDLNVAGAISLFDRLSIALEIPATLYQGGSLPADTTPSFRAIAFGDLRLSPKLYLLDAKRFFIDLSILLSLTVPTSTAGSFAGDRNISFSGELDASRRFGPFRAALNIGAGWRAPSIYYDLAIGPELYGRAGIGFDIGSFTRHVPLELLAEVYGRTALLAPFANPSQNPMEGVFGIRAKIIDELHIIAGAGRGLLGGYGAPIVRAFIGITVVPLQHKEKPATVAAATLPVSAPASVPTPVVEKPVVEKPAVVKTVEPEAPHDSDGDGIADKDDQCPNEPEVVNGINDFDGCPDTGRSLVVITKTSILILEKVQFARAQDRILPKSFGLLDQVANTLKNHNAIKRLRVEGHTDSDGRDDTNLALSQRRADAVRNYLVMAGVAADRLVAVGYGETKMIAPNTSKKGKEQNRRVAFTVIDE